MERDALSEKAIRSRLRCPHAPDIRLHSVLDSTNLEARRIASGAADGTLIVADAQTAGRGRLGRGFFSPPGRGVYMTVLFTFRQGADQLPLVTAAAAVAAALAVGTVCGRMLKIKWVNDLLYDGKKVGGILAETAVPGPPARVVLGIGVNFTAPKGGFPPEAGNAGALFDRPPAGISRSHLIAAVYDNVLEMAAAPDLVRFLPEYRRRSAVLGKRVLVGGTRPALAEEIDDAGRLGVLLDTGGRMSLNGEEISIVEEKP